MDCTLTGDGRAISEVAKFAFADILNGERNESAYGEVARRSFVSVWPYLLQSQERQDETFISFVDCRKSIAGGP